MDLNSLFECLMSLFLVLMGSWRIFWQRSYPGRSYPGITFSVGSCQCVYAALNTKRLEFSRNAVTLIPPQFLRRGQGLKEFSSTFMCLTEGGGIVFVTVIRPSTLPSGCKPGHSQLTVYAKYTGAMAS